MHLFQLKVFLDLLETVNLASKVFLLAVKRIFFDLKHTELLELGFAGLKVTFSSSALSESISILSEEIFFLLELLFSHIFFDTVSSSCSASYFASRVSGSVLSYMEFCA